ncbi:hypothetical protein, partial [Methanocalculus sp.]|uniref:hypothetical protein n=1 Tax=Methanocalculus sp. TaxID=2004547 RepID=UPI0027194BE5
FAILLVAGCIQPTPPVGEVTPVQTPAPPVQTVPPTPPPIIPEPYLLKGAGIYGMSTDLSASEQGTNLLITVAFDSSNTLGVTSGSGVEMYVTLFAYNIVDLPEGYLPASQQEIRDAGIPFKVRRTIIYPMNELKVTAELPLESSVGRLDIRSPYNYGAILEKIV